MALEARKVDDLLHEHGTQVEALRERVEDVLPASGVTEDGVQVDELFLLRYVLSNRKKIEGAADKVRETLAWRKENTDLLCMLRDGKPHPMEREISEFLLTGVVGSLVGGEPISVVRMGLSDFRKLMHTYSVAEVAEYLMFEKERMFRICDAETRARGVLVKSITIIDFDSFSMFGSRFDNRFFSALGESSKRSSVYYPQLQVKTVAINTPSYYNMLHKTLGSVMPKSSMEKMVMCPARQTQTKSASACPFMKANEGVEAVPPFLGGTGALPISLTPPTERPGDFPLHTIKIANRSFATVELDIEYSDTIIEFEAMVDSYHLLMTAEMVPDRGDRLPRNRTGSTFSVTDKNLDDVRYSLAREMSLASAASGSHRGGRGAGDRDKSRDEYDEDDEDDEEDKGPYKVEHMRAKKNKQQKRPKRPKDGTKTQGNHGEERSGAKRRVSARVLGPDEASPLSGDTVPGVPAARHFSLNPTMAPMRLDSADGMVKGTWKLPMPGKLYIKFDNSFSRLRSKKLTFRITTVVPPQDEEELSWWESNWGEFAKQVRWPTEDSDTWDCVVS
ncbi:Phosphatidylinositol/phosphatidylcholine transfer protein SFH2 [Hondaea fermentalgiana]|uniref:Phosphatidylinositol/phosphatidylcholine transfer protein SFH2 n=1 Tax=Hondaea fermentalgiana TaxID=2315210 RepID=A0A2R5G6E5_9STRA|nr:Phosphatidylinositol/phosphatidylcholine transfer protein SFH2 [Hondaea fermentalgiana]|eukprot:GBG24013.1 Phosphatidylinositol/phosphatidylcholine transfer protein SFH2 [Hondaea fermentalgiana]